ncbi:MAG: histidinol-phosphatase HisJ family protein [Clostridia bacterium]|nr:histidinol-phosphatase HisJ family protein [Clostridia bacterium]
MFDTHIHTHNSHDSEQEIDALCRSAIEKGVNAVSLTDHIDVFAYSEEHNTKVITGSAKDADYAKSTYSEELKIFKGVEVGVYHYDSEMSKKICSLCELDIILGSVHSFMLNGEKVHFSRDNISEEVLSKEKLINQADAYFNEMLATAETADIDVLCHLTYPLRYINAKYNRNLDINIYSAKITQILKTLIERQIALEINTARVGTDFNYTAPTFDIVNEYYNLGGRLITIGSDAHTPEKIANGFDYVKTALKEIGFDKYYYFEKRRPKSVKL